MESNEQQENPAMNNTTNDLYEFAYKKIFRVKIPHKNYNNVLTGQMVCVAIPAGAKWFIKNINSVSESYSCFKLWTLHRLHESVHY